MGRPRYILSFHHEWKQKLPLSQNKVVCIDCGVVTPIGQWDVAKCTGKIELLSSGYSGEEI